MPVYEYQCEKCSFQFELKRSFHDNSIVICPKCEGGARRIFSPVPIVFKGTGFYTTDNRKKEEPWHNPSMDEHIANAKPTPNKSPEQDAK